MTLGVTGRWIYNGTRGICGNSLIIEATECLGIDTHDCLFFAPRLDTRVDRVVKAASEPSLILKVIDIPSQVLNINALG